MFKKILQFILDTLLPSPLNHLLSFINPLTKKKREMDYPVGPPRLNGLKFTSVASLALTTSGFKPYELC